MKKSLFIGFVCGFAVAFFLCIWLVSPFAVDILSSWKVIGPGDGPINFAVRGQFGDSFGVATSIFSFLSFSGVLFVYFMQRRHLDTRDKPFLMTSILPNSVPMKLSRTASASRYTLLFKFGINNFSEHLAHSCIFQCEMRFGEKSWALEPYQEHRPVMRRDVDMDIETKWVLDLTPTMWFLDALSSGHEVDLKIKILYVNSNGIKYADVNNFKILLDEVHYAAVNELRARKTSEEVWGGNKFVTLEISQSSLFVTSV